MKHFPASLLIASLLILALSVCCKQTDKAIPSGQEIDYAHLPTLATTFDGNGIGWEPADGVLSYIVLKNGKEWKSLRHEFFIITIGEKGEFRIVGLDEGGKPLSASESILINMPPQKRIQ